MDRLKALVAAAGRGSRAGLPYPKTLHPVQGVPILIRLLTLLDSIDACPTIIVSPDGQPLIAECLRAHGRGGHLVVQPQPLGMGDAVLRFAQSPAFPSADHVLLAWGDIPLIQPQTVTELIRVHFEHDNDFTLATREVEAAYTVVTRNARGGVQDVTETRESGVGMPLSGERDIGLFVFRKDAVMEALRREVPQRYGRATGEHGFLYVIGQLVAAGKRVEALPIATELDLVSLNKLEDLEGHA